MFPDLGGFMHQVGKHGASFGCSGHRRWCPYDKRTGAFEPRR
jgi:hypothetical protein